MIEQSTLSRALRSSDGNDLVVHSSLIKLVFGEKFANKRIVELSGSRDYL